MTAMEIKYIAVLSKTYISFNISRFKIKIPQGITLVMINKKKAVKNAKKRLFKNMPLKVEKLTLLLLRLIFKIMHKEYRQISVKLFKNINFKQVFWLIPKRSADNKKAL